jgi:hypothetical protein
VIHSPFPTLAVLEVGSGLPLLHSNVSASMLQTAIMAMSDVALAIAVKT